MEVNGGNIYQISRKQAKISQETAAEMLNLDVKTLSNYENGKSPVPMETVALMAEKYNVYSLVFYHIKYNTAAGKFFPDYVEPQSLADMGFQAVIANKKMDANVVKLIDTIQDYNHNESLPKDKEKDFIECMDNFKSIGGKITSVEVYGRQYKFAE